MKPKRAYSKEDCRLIFRRENAAGAPEVVKADIILALSRALERHCFLQFVRPVDAGYTINRALTVLIKEGVLANRFSPAYNDLLVTAIRAADPAVIVVEANE